MQVGNQIITASSNQVSNAINGVTLNLSGTGGPSMVTVAPDLRARKPDKCFRNRLQHRGQRRHQQYPGGANQTAPPLANDGGLRSTLFNLQSQLGTLDLSKLGISVNQQTGQLTFSQANFMPRHSSNPARGQH